MAATAAPRMDGAFDRRFWLLFSGTLLGSAMLIMALMIAITMIEHPGTLRLSLAAVGWFLIMIGSVGLCALPIAGAVWGAVWLGLARAGVSAHGRAMTGSFAAVIGVAAIVGLFVDRHGGHLGSGLVLAVFFCTPAALGIAPLLAARLYRQADQQ